MTIACPPTRDKAGLPRRLFPEVARPRPFKNDGQSLLLYHCPAEFDLIAGGWDYEQ
jgi:hypothetical protein